MKTTKAANDLVDRYLSLWHNPDPEARRKAIHEVWASDGAQILVDPPQEIRDAADGLQFSIPPLEVHGYDALEARITRAYEMFVEPGEYVFQLRGEVSQLLDHVITFNWDMVTTDGERAGGGADMFVLDGNGQVRLAYQTIGNVD
jgi:hypothetical protein